MALLPGTRIGAYEIVSQLGAGGLGVVYRAHDTRLQRDVAIKLLNIGGPADARLLHEGRAIAALNHPHICDVYEVGEADGYSFIAMELIEGRSLSAVAAAGPLPCDRVCRIGRQLAEALEHAHTQGVIHRDVKSGNVVLTTDGQVKVVDFGLALRNTTSLDRTETLTLEPGSRGLAGTIAYMAPELFDGAAPDVRTDVWALGVVLYELTAGRRPFTGDTTSDLIAAIRRDLPGPLPASTPAALARIIERCLAKEPPSRPRRAGEVAFALEAIEPRALATGTEPAPRRPIAVLAAAVVLVALVAVAYWIRPRQSTGSGAPRFTNPVHVTTAAGVEEFPAWSPDGRMIAYAGDAVGSVNSSTWDIWVTQLNQPGGGTPINRTADYGGRDMFPSWSPDGSQIAFWSDRDGGGCYVMPALAGVPRRVGPASPLDPNPPQWSEDGTEIGCVSGNQADIGVDVIAVSTGETRRHIDLPGDARRMFVSWSRDQRRIALVVSSAGLSADLTQLLVLDVASGKWLALTDGQSKVWSPAWSADGRTLFYVAPSGATLDLWEQRFASDGTPSGAAQVLTAGIGMRNAGFSRDGRRLAYSQGRKVANVYRAPLRTGAAATWADVEQLTFDQAFIECVDVNRAGTELAVNSDRAGSIDLWTLSTSGGPMKQLTADRSAEWCPSWSPDGSTLAFYAFRTGDREIWTIPAAGGEWRRLTHNPLEDLHPSWSADGRSVLHLTRRVEGTGGWATPIDGSPGRMVVPNSLGYRWSPVDTRLAYRKDGRFWIMDTATPIAPRLLPTTRDGAMRWTPDGRDLLYRASDRTVAIVAADGHAGERVLLDLAGRRGALGDYGTPTDGTFIYFTWNEDLGDIWVMDVSR